MNNLNILYMGTPAFAVAPLEKLLEEKHTITAVVTAPDRPAGRGRKPKASAVKKFALSKKIEVLQPENLKSDDFQADLKRLNINLIIVVAFRMLPQKVWAFPEFGTFNLHASLLPNYRGAAPINWAIINGEDKTGVTTFMIDEKIDTGKILLQEELEVRPQETAGELHDRLQVMGANLVHKTVQGIEKDSIKSKAQENNMIIMPAPKLNRANTKIDWEQSGKNTVQLIHGLSPFPSAWCYFQNGDQELQCKIYRAAFEKEDQRRPVGQVYIENKKLKISVNQGFISISELQVSGKRRMKAQDFLNGIQLDKSAKMS
jgi:methionyl-tRNA formyltransferase